jgi:hypothetical protein
MSVVGDSVCAMSEDLLDGVLIAESLLPDVELDELELTVTRIVRSTSGARSPDQPKTWTLLYFQAPVESSSRLAETFASVLQPTGGWYVDWNAGADKYVVFADRIFRYPRGDQAGRAEAQAHGRDVGVPEPQLDWGG